MEKVRRGMVAGIGITLAAMCTPSSAAQDWKPERAIELIVPSTPGGSFDRSARLIEKIARENKLVDSPIVIVNKPGGGGNVAVAHLQQRPRDGHSLMITSNSFVTNHILGRSEHTYRDFTPVVTLFNEYISTIVPEGSALVTPATLVERLRKDPAAVSVGFCCAMGGGNHLAAVMLVRAVGGDVGKMKNVVFRGAGLVTTALMGGHIHAASLPASNVVGAVAEGKLHIVAVAAPQRLGGPLKNVPTWKEQGHEVVMGLWKNLIGPAGMPPEHVRYWEQVLAKVARTEAWQADLTKNTWIDDFKNSAETTRYLDDQYRTQSAILSAVGLARK